MDRLGWWMHSLYQIFHTFLIYSTSSTYPSSPFFPSLPPPPPPFSSTLIVTYSVFSCAATILRRIWMSLKIQLHYDPCNLAMKSIFLRYLRPLKSVSMKRWSGNAYLPLKLSHIIFIYFSNKSLLGSFFKLLFYALKKMIACTAENCTIVSM